MTVLFLDTETFNETPIRQGTYRYAETVEITIAAWAVDDGPVRVEDLTMDYGPPVAPTRALQDAIRDADTVVMHKSDFDRNVIKAAWGIDIPVERIHDTMVRALAHGLPGSLDKLSDIFRLGELGKDSGGQADMLFFCKPLPKNQKLRRATRATHPERWARFLSYAGSDILSMRELFYKLPKWNYGGPSVCSVRETSLWHLDQRINDRGFQLDVGLAEAAVGAVASEQRRLRLRVADLTDGQVAKATQRDELLALLLAEYGVDLPDMKKDTLERRLEDPELPDAVKQLIEVRLAATTSSTAKYNTILRAMSKDGRLRGSLQFAGAKRTARWSGRLFQPQNLPRPDLEADEVELYIDACKAGALELVTDEPGEDDYDWAAWTTKTKRRTVMKVLSDALRGLIVAAPGKVLYSSDIANIESVVTAWLGGEQWKLDGFQEVFDAKARGDKTVADMYQRSYAASFGIKDPTTVKGDPRQVGKVQELVLGFEGGVGAFVAFAAVYRLDLDKLADAIWATADQESIEKAQGMLKWRRKKRLTTYGLSDRVYVACEVIKANWRKAHPGVAKSWPALKDAAINATLRPGQTFEACGGKIKFIRQGAWLRMILPSGRSLCYAQPEVKGEGDKATLSYMGENQYTRKWQRIHTYGGKFMENAAQAIARDVMAHNMLAIEAAGFEIVLTVHDDVICEADEHLGLTSSELSGLLATKPPWFGGCPLYAAGFAAQRYRKD